MMSRINHFLMLKKKAPYHSGTMPIDPTADQGRGQQQMPGGTVPPPPTKKLKQIPSTSTIQTFVKQAMDSTSTERMQQEPGLLVKNKRPHDRRR
jgi:hypothetical protein